MILSEPKIDNQSKVHSKSNNFCDINEHACAARFGATFGRNFWLLTEQLPSSSAASSSAASPLCVDEYHLLHHVRQKER